MSRPRKHRTTFPAYVRIRHGSFVYKDKKLCRVDEGEAKMYEALASRKLLGSLDRIPAAVAQFKLDYLPTLSPSARKEHQRLLDVFADEFSDFRVDQVSAADIKRSIKNLYAGKDSAAKHYKSRISTFFRWAVTEQELLTVNPCREVWVKKPIPKKTPWTDTLFYAVRDKLSPMHQCYHDLSFLLYQRTTDIRELERTQIRDGVIHFEPSKTLDSSGMEVDVPITGAIQAVLERAAALRKEWGVVCPYVVCTRQGTAYTRSGIYSAYRRVDKQLHGEDLLNLNPKALLPYAVTTAKRQGATMEQLREARAHRSIKTTEGYIQSHDVPVSAVVMDLPKRP